MNDVEFCHVYFLLAAIKKHAEKMQKNALLLGLDIFYPNSRESMK